MSKRTWISFGENCLTQTLINNIGLNTTYTPFTFTRTNPDYVLHFERNGYDLLKDKDNFVQRDEQFYKTSYKNEIDTGKNFIQASRVLAFGHHDVLESEDAMQKISRRADRMPELRDKKLSILYYHMVDADTDSFPSLEKTGNGMAPSRIYILKKLKQIKKYYPNADILFFYRVHSNTRSVSLVSSDNSIYEFAISTPNLWCELNWEGRTDYDLLLTMIDQFNSYIKD